MIVSVCEAIARLRKGEVVAIPTETVYGLAAPIDNIDAIGTIFSTKARPFFDPLIVHISRLSQLEDIVQPISPSVASLAQKLWPGPLTLILSKTPQVSDLITSGLPEVGVRFPKHALTQEIIDQTGPLAAPSANKFGKTSPTSAAHVELEFSGQVAVVDGGPCIIGIESTVVRIRESEQEIEINILRPGGYEERDFLTALSGMTKKIVFTRASAQAAPGQLENHYQPETPLLLGATNKTWSESTHKNFCEKLKQTFNAPPVIWSLVDTDPTRVARTLYNDMRKFSAHALQWSTYIYVIPPYDFDSLHWEAVRDRLQKASTKF